MFRATEGLWKKYGDDRVVDTPLAEIGIMGAAIGLAINGLRPVAEIQFEGLRAGLRPENHGARYWHPQGARSPSR